MSKEQKKEIQRLADRTLGGRQWRNGVCMQDATQEELITFATALREKDSIEIVALKEQLRDSSIWRDNFERDAANLCSKLTVANRIISQFDSCIRSIADALGNPACGGVDVPISDPLGTAAVLVGAVEAAKQRIADLSTNILAKNLVRDMQHSRIVGLEKKLAAQQPDCARYARLRVLGAAPMDSLALSSGTVMRFQSLDAFIDEDIRAYGSRGEVTRTEELTKLLAAARQQGFEEGKQAGRDELQLAGWFLYNDYHGWQQLAKDVWGKTDIEGLEGMMPLYSQPPRSE